MKKIRQFLLCTTILTGSILIAGCGATAQAIKTPTVAHSTSVSPHKTAVSSTATWHIAAHIPAQDSVLGTQVAPHGLWIFLKTPATVNHGPEYRGAFVSAQHPGLTWITPPVLSPPTTDTIHPKYWGRTTGGVWWFTVFGQASSGNRKVRTVLWSSPHHAWTALPSLTVQAPHNGVTTPHLTLMTGQHGHGWMVANYEGVLSSYSAQSWVYHLSSRGWHLIHTFPSASSNDQWIVWDAPGTPGTLYISPEGPGQPVLLTASGRIAHTFSIPSTLLQQMNNYSLISIAFSSTGTSFWTNNSSTLWSWHAQQVHSLITPGSLLAQGFTWQGLWRNQPIVTASSGLPYLYTHHHWVAFPAWNRTSSAGTSTPAAWNGQTLWSVGSSAIWVRHLTAAQIPTD